MGHACERILKIGCIVTKACVARVPFGGHLSEDRLSPIDVVEDDHLALRRVQTVEPACVLRQRAAPGDGHCQEQGIEARIVEALAQISSSGEQYAFLGCAFRLIVIADSV
jgi:hypothetical protein